MTAEALVVLSTAPSLDEGRTLGRRLVEERLAACVNVVPSVQSVFRWQGAIEEAEEALLVINTRPERYAELERRIQALHSYSVPEILALPVASGAPAYLNWLRDTVSGGGDASP